MGAKRVAGIVLGVGLILLLVTLVVPIYDFPTDARMGDPVYLYHFVGSEGTIAVVLGVLAAMVLAVLALLGRTNWVWGLVALLAGLAMASSLLTIEDVASYCWDGQDEQGRPIGDCSSAGPVVGWWLALAGAAVVTVAGAIRLGAGRTEAPTR